MNHQQTPKQAALRGHQALEFLGNAGPGGPPLPRRRDSPPRTPSAVDRRERFARDHPEIPITSRREDASLVFDVAEPGREVEVYRDADAMMDDLEARYP